MKNEEIYPGSFFKKYALPRGVHEFHQKEEEKVKMDTQQIND